MKEAHLLADMYQRGGHDDFLCLLLQSFAKGVDIEDLGLHGHISSEARKATGTELDPQTRFPDWLRQHLAQVCLSAQHAPLTSLQLYIEVSGQAWPWCCSWCAAWSAHRSEAVRARWHSVAGMGTWGHTCTCWLSEPFWSVSPSMRSSSDRIHLQALQQGLVTAMATGKPVQAWLQPTCMSQLTKLMLELADSDCKWRLVAGNTG